MEKDKMCECGDSENQHVDGSEQCFIVGCRCGGFEEAGIDTDQEALDALRADQ